MCYSTVKSCQPGLQQTERPSIVKELLFPIMDHSEPIYVSVLTTLLTIGFWCINIIYVCICAYVTTSWCQKYPQIE